MFTQIVSRVSTVSEGTANWIAESFTTIHSYIEKITRKNAKKVSALMMASKLLSVAVLLTLIPLNTTKVTKDNNVAEIKFDQANAMAVVGKNRQVVVTTGESNIDVQSKPASRQIAYASPTQSVERDPSYFRGLYQRAGATYGVPWQLIEAVHYIETGASDSTTISSYAGAQGPMQFMPGTWRAYGVDANGDGQASIHNVDDAVFGAANLLAQGGAAEGDYQAALYNYNHSQSYVNKVLAVARDAGM